MRSDLDLKSELSYIVDNSVHYKGYSAAQKAEYRCRGKLALLRRSIISKINKDTFKEAQPEDVNGDGTIDLVDIRLICNTISSNYSAEPEDANEDDTIDLDDLNVIIEKLTKLFNKTDPLFLKIGVKYNKGKYIVNNIDVNQKSKDNLTKAEQYEFNKAALDIYILSEQLKATKKKLER